MFGFIKKQKITPYIICILICLIIAKFAGYATQSSLKTWHLSIIKPSFTPPDWLFAPVWISLYIMMGFAWGHLNRIIINKTLRKKYNILFGVQLIFNMLWSFIYFGAHGIGFALIDIILLWIVLVFTIYQFFFISKLAGWLLVPYLLWTTYAGILNAVIWYLNKDNLSLI